MVISFLRDHPLSPQPQALNLVLQIGEKAITIVSLEVL